jgi:hypothetical protein
MIITTITAVIIHDLPDQEVPVLSVKEMVLGKPETEPALETAQQVLPEVQVLIVQLQ